MRFVLLISAFVHLMCSECSQLQFKCGSLKHFVGYKWYTEIILYQIRRQRAEIKPPSNNDKVKGKVKLSVWLNN
jgi:hypothetical protein